MARTKKMIHGFWSKIKPNFNEECILIVATWFKNNHNLHWEYTLYTVEKIQGYNSKDEPSYYWGLICDDGEEWGDITDLKADLYFTMKLLNKK